MNFHVLNNQFQQLSAHGPFPSPLDYFKENTRHRVMSSVICQYISLKNKESNNQNPMTHLKTSNDSLIR